MFDKVPTSFTVGGSTLAVTFDGVISVIGLIVGIIGLIVAYCRYKEAKVANKEAKRANDLKEFELTHSTSDNQDEPRVYAQDIIHKD